VGHVATTPDGRRISYAQNGEDIVLLRLFAGQAHGVWIDVGANHPINDSVTKNFSDLGWWGLNVEPVESFFRALVADRPRDVNINAAVSDHTGTMTFHRNDSNLDLSTFDEGLVAHYRERGDRITDIDVPVRRLDEICEEHLGDHRIDFMKVDTEGHELSVLRSHDFERYPVRVLLAEATRDRLADLVAAVEAAGMSHVMFDGLNAWFVARDEFDELAPRLTPPSMVLDWYHPRVYVAMMDERDQRIAALQAVADTSNGAVAPQSFADAMKAASRAALRPLRRQR